MTTRRWTKHTELLGRGAREETNAMKRVPPSARMKEEPLSAATRPYQRSLPVLCQNSALLK